MTVAPYKDTDITHDHTYFGRGCSNGWGTSGEGGSQTPCVDSDAGGRYVTTYDGETQKNGTYYHYQAATSGSGGTITTDNAISRDSFCPLGWQLPYGGTGGDYYDKSKSVTFLFNTYTITIDSQGSIKARSYPISMIASGLYFWQNGQLYNQGSAGGLWTSTNENSNRAWLISIAITSVDPKNTDGNKVAGYALRCVFHRRHGGRNPCRFDSVY